MLEQSLDAIIGDGKTSSSRGAARGPGSRKNMRGPRNAGSRPPRRVTAESIPGVGRANEIKILNLHPDLTVEDLTKLMQTVGEVTRVEIKYNTHGQSTGIAFVEFKNVHEANAAISKFDGRLAAGQVITVTTTLKLADRIGSGRGNNMRNAHVPSNRVRKDRGGRSGRGGRGGKKSVRPRKTLEDLDKELNAYMGVGETGGVSEVNSQPVVEQVEPVETSETIMRED